ncbi:MAG: DUF4364 family protein [Lachnospiraceae bacterium]|nr:DUF4364 family protein [Lachnospiraceae bacterium]
MTQDTNLLYKLIVLFMLDQVEFPLTNSQIVEYVIDRGYTNYFTLQSVINDLVESEMIYVENVRNSSLYHIQSAGREAIEMFGDRMSSAIKEDILLYFEENRFELRNEVEITAEYYNNKKDDYFIHGVIKEKGNILLELTLNVGTKDDAVRICDHWNKNSSDVYGMLVEKLILG